MAIWQAVDINTGEVELPKYDATGDFSEIAIASVTTALANGDTIMGPVVQAGLWVTDVIAAPDAIDSAATILAAYEVGYISAGVFTPGAFIASGALANGGVQHMNVAAGYGFQAPVANNITVAASITAGAGTAVAGKFRLGVVLNATP